MISRRKNPLDRPGRRTFLACSPAALAVLRDAAAARGITQRMVIDELLGDAELVAAAADRAAAGIETESAAEKDGDRQTQQAGDDQQQPADGADRQE
jgi:hypothetical protein